MFLTRMLVVLLLAGFAAGSVATAETIWREGEDTTADTMNRHPWWYDKVKADELSGGKWISNFNQQKAAEASYDVKVEGGEYNFWVRANPTKSKLSWKVDKGEWKEVDFTDVQDQRNIAADEKPDLRFIGWVYVGKLELAEGGHTVRFRMHSETQNHGAIDVFVLTTGQFDPKGKTRPGQAVAGQPDTPAPVLAVEESWAFDPPEDRFTDDAMFDLRSMNESVAGENGFIRLDVEGSGFVRGDGEPIRFWSVCSYGYRLSPADMDHHFRFLAKLGVNMVRFHANISPSKEGQSVTDVNAEEIDRLLRGVAAARRHGIYVTISPYWYHHKMPASWGIAGYKAGDMPTGALFFNPKLKAGYKSWVKELYTRPNPYAGGVALKDDPAVAIIQVKNEDSLLFYTFDRLPAEQKRILGKMFGDWLVERYGSLATAAEAWDNARADGDDPENGVMGFYITWFFTQPAEGGRDKRLSDQLQFIAETQRGFYAEIDDYYKNTLGCRQLTNAMNWKSADKMTTDDVERWTYTACDVIAVNRYAGGRHIGQNNGYRIDPGHHLVNRSLLKAPLQLPCALKQVAGRPMMITETTWVHPNLYQSEGPFLMAAYRSVNGVDALFWFAQGAKDWLRDPRRMFWRVGDSYALDKWSCATSQVQGMFPANALLYRMGYLQPGETVVHEERTPEAMWRREPPIIAETETFDPIRDEQDLRGQDAKSNVSRLAFLVGKVEVVFDGDPAKTQVADLSPYIDGERNTVRSTTGEVQLDYGRGVCTVDAPKAQGVSGFLKDAGGVFEMGTVKVESGNAYASVSVVAMDDRPLAESGRILVQVGTVSRLTGWTVKPDTVEDRDETVDALRILNTGTPPWRCANTLVTLTVKNPGITKATLLDTAGYAAGEVPVRQQGGAAVIELPKNTMYLVLQ